jgi:chromosome partitioning protein
MTQIRILAIAAGRGGTGKSTLAFAIADALRHAEPEIDVALVDLDPQAGLTGYAKRAPAADPVREQPVGIHGLTLYRGGRALARATEEEIAEHVERALGGRTDRVLVIDMAPSLTDVAHRVVFARDDVMLLGAIRTEPGSFQSLNELVTYVSKRGLPYVLVPTIHRSIMLNNMMLLTMRQQHHGHVSDAIIPLDGKAAECVIKGQPVTMYAKSSKAAKAVRQLVDELFGGEGSMTEKATEVPVASAEDEPADATPRARSRTTERPTAPTAAAEV